MLRRYAIVEVDKRLRSAGATPHGGAKAVEKIRIHGADLSKRDVREIARDPNVEDYGHIMPSRLVRPVRKQAIEARVAPPTPWGIAAVGADRVDLDGSGVVVAVWTPELTAVTRHSLAWISKRRISGARATETRTAMGRIAPERSSARMSEMSGLASPEKFGRRSSRRSSRTMGAGTRLPSSVR